MNISIFEKIDRIHPYPAKFTINLALDYIDRYTNKGDVVYDPFVGSGTVTMASSILDRKGYGSDINYIAILISKFKLLHFSNSDFNLLDDFFIELQKDYNNNNNQILYTYPSINHWFGDNSIFVLSYIKEKISRIKKAKIRTFCELVMSNIINIVSNQESDTRYAAIEKTYTKNQVFDIYINKFESIKNIFKLYNKEKRNSICKVELLDSCKCREFIKEKIDLVITSPPYINTYDYYLYHKHRMNWLGYDAKFSMENEIGSRREFSSLKHDKEKFNEDLFKIFTETNGLLKNKGKAVIIIGDGKVDGKIYNAKTNMLKIAKKLGWQLIDYSYSCLDDTSRSFQQSFRSKGKKEHVLVFEKEKKNAN